MSWHKWLRTMQRSVLNLAVTTFSPGNYTDLVKRWYDEVQVYDYVTNTCSGVCGHYTQVCGYVF